MGHAIETATRANFASLMGQTFINLIYMKYHLLELALDADYTNSEIKAGLTPTRALFKDVKELAYISEVDGIIEAALMRVGTSSKT